MVAARSNQMGSEPPAPEPPGATDFSTVRPKERKAAPQKKLNVDALINK